MSDFKGAAVQGDDGAQLALDLVKIDSPLVGKVKGDRNTMVFNFFSLRREKVTRLPPYNDGTTWIEVAGTHHGVANIWDKEILIYAASLLADRMNKGEAPSARLTFSAHDFLQATGSTAGGSNYERVTDSLERLKSTFIKTNIETGGEGEDRGFGWLDEYRILYRRGRDGQKVMRAIEITLCSWLFRAIVNDRHLLTYHPRYFELPPMGKRLYEIARSGPQSGFRMALPKLLSRVGSNQTPRRFKLDIAQYAEGKKAIPEYRIALLDPKLRRSIDPAFANQRGALTRSKTWMVAFYPTSELGPSTTMDTLPVLEDDDADEAPQGETLLFEAEARKPFSVTEVGPQARQRKPARRLPARATASA